MSKLPKIDIIKVNIGDSIYRYVSFGGIREFKVVGKRWYEDNIQLEVEEYITNGCVYSFRVIRMNTATILTLKPEDIKTLHISNPELFL